MNHATCHVTILPDSHLVYITWAVYSMHARESCVEACGLCFAAVPGFIILFAGIILPESPSSLAERGNINQAKKVFSLRLPVRQACGLSLHWYKNGCGCLR